MCGIAGVFALDRALLAPIGRMTEALRHRGPDDEGYLLADTAGGRATPYSGKDTLGGIPHPRLPPGLPEGTTLALGHRRLSILDLGPGGHGPMASRDGRSWVTYNGEIYNYVELREELRARGHAFATASDTEVLLAAYAEWGEEALTRFNGMFAFALYDSRRGVLFCARDRFGVKPFHYYWDGSLFAFASEIKGLLAHPGVPRRANEPYVLGFLVEGALDESEGTFFAGIRSLPASHCLSLGLAERRLSLRRWYELPHAPERPLEPDAFRELLRESVRLRLRSDVDVGTCLSGGLDSSSIVALTASLRDASHAGGRHRAFSVLYDDPGLAEGPHVEAVVAATGVLAERTTASAAGLARDLPALMRHQDEPIPSAGPYSHWRVMELAHRAGMKVLLDGQGADEILAGYHYHYGPFLAEVLATRGLAAALAEASAARAVTGRPAWFFLGQLAYHALPLPGALARRAVARFATHGRVPARLLDPALLAKAGALPGERHVRRASLLAERHANLWATSLPALLRYEDRNSMAFGIEARTPFLDYRVVEAALAAPARQLVSGGWTKALLREAMRGLLPESVRLRRDKLGFSTPEARFLTELAPQVRAWLGPGSRVSGLLRKGALKEWLAASDPALGRRRGLWRLVCLEHWLRYAEGPRAPSA